MDFNLPEPNEKIIGEKHSLFNTSDPESLRHADPSALLSMEVLKIMLAEGGPLAPGQVREVVSTGTITLAGIVYETALSFKVGLRLKQGPPPMVPPPNVPDDVYRRIE